MDLLISVITMLFLGLGVGAGIAIAILFALWYMENKL